MAHLYHWIWVSFIAGLFASIFLLYSFFTGHSLSIQTAGSTLAFTGMFLIIASFAVGDMGFYFPFFTRFLKYRREVGLFGFFVILGHVYTSIFHLSNLFPFPTSYLQENTIYPFLAALLALEIFAVMALVSNALAMKLLGGHLWRALLRIGYIGVILALVHMILRDQSEWIAWGNNMISPPPLSVLIAWLGVWTILLRIGMLFLAKKHT